MSKPSKDDMWGIAAKASPKGTLDGITAFGRTDFRGDVDKVNVPTLVIHGDSDGVVPFEVSGRRSAELIKDATLHGINASHAEEFNTAVIDVLKS